MAGLLHRRRRPASRLVPLFPALPCGRARARLRTAWSRPAAGRSIRRDARCRSRSGMSSIRWILPKRLGAEIVRLWVASVDFREDVRASEDLMQRVAENYRKIRNTFRYILGNLKGFDPATDALSFDELQPFDQYILLRLAEVTRGCARLVRRVQLPQALHAAEGFLRRGSERGVLRRDQGPSLHLRAASRRSAARHRPRSGSSVRRW